MKKFMLMLCLVSALPVMAGQQMSVSKQEALAIGTEAYIYGYPLVTMEMTRRVVINVAAPEAMRAPMGRFVLMLRLYWPKDTVINGAWKLPGVKRVGSKTG